MSFWERIEQNLPAAVATSALGALLWLIRTVFTNQKKVELLEREIKNRDQRREEDRELMRETREEVRSIRQDVTDLLSKD